MSVRDNARMETTLDLSRTAEILALYPSDILRDVIDSQRELGHAFGYIAEAARVELAKRGEQARPSATSRLPSILTTALESLQRYVFDVDDLRGSQLKQLHAENAELRDAILALSNRQESLTRLVQAGTEHLA